MAKQGDPICKCNSTKVDASIKKSNGAKTRGWSKGGVKKKAPRRIDSGFWDQNEHDDYDTNESEDSQSDDEGDPDEMEDLNI